MVVDYFILKRSRATLDASRAKGELPEKVEKWNPHRHRLLDRRFRRGRGHQHHERGHSGLNSLILAGVLYWIVMKVYASMKKVDTVTSRKRTKCCKARRSATRRAASGADEAKSTPLCRESPDQQCKPPMFHVKHRGLLRYSRSRPLSSQYRAHDASNSSKSCSTDGPYYLAIDIPVSMCETIPHTQHCMLFRTHSAAIPRRKAARLPQ